MRTTAATIRKSCWCDLAVLAALALVITSASHASQQGRAADVERRIAERKAELEQRPNDPMLLADQAADYYFGYLEIDGAGWTALLGIANENQRRRAQRAGRAIYELAQRAASAVEEQIQRLEASPEFANDLDLQRDRRRLAEEERDRRIPFFVGIGASVRAHVEDLADEQRRELLNASYETLSKVAPRLAGPLAARAQWHAAMSAVKLGRDDDSRELLDAALGQEDIEPIVRFAARLTRASLGDERSEREFDRMASERQYQSSIFHRLLIADRVFMQRRERSLTSAVRAYESLLRHSFGLPRESARALVLARIADAVADVDQSSLPPLAVIAVAERGVGSGNAEPQTLEQLQRVLADEGASVLEHAQAIYTLARLHHVASEKLDAARVYLRLALEHPGQPEAAQAIEYSIALAADRSAAGEPAARDVLRAGLELAIDKYSLLPPINDWRIMAGHLALSESRYLDAAQLFEQVTNTHEKWLDARVLGISALRRATSTIDKPEVKSPLLHKLIDSAVALAPHLERAAAAADAARAVELRGHLVQIRIDHAAALVALGSPAEALDALDKLAEEDAIDAPVLADALEVRIEALQALGRTTDAQQQIDRFLHTAGPAQVRSVVRPMLESLMERARSRNGKAPAAAELEELALRLVEWMRKDDAERFEASLAHALAESLRLTEHYGKSLALYDRLLEHHSNAAPLLLGRAECLYHLGAASKDEQQLAQAITIYRRLISAGSDSGMHDTYWQAQLRSLQILDAIGRNTSQIVPQIQRLRLRDPGLGGERYRREFERLQNKHAARNSS